MTAAAPTATRTPRPSRCAPPGRSSSRTCSRRPRPEGHPQGAVIGDGNLCCPQAPRTLLELGPLARAAAGSGPRTTAQGQRLARCELGRLTSDDQTAPTGCSAPPQWARSAAPAPRVNGAGPEPAQDPHPAARPPGVLHPAHHHRPAGRARQDRAEARLRVRGLAPLLRPPHQRRARLRHRQGPRQQPHHPRLVPPHGPDAPHAVHRHAARRPATSASSPPGTPARKTTSAGPPKAGPPKPASAAARPSPCSPPPARPRSGGTREHHQGSAPRRRQHARKPPQASRNQPGEHEPHTTRQKPGCAPECQTQT